MSASTSSSCVYINNNLYVFAHLQQNSVSCEHVHQSLMYVHASIAFNPCMCVYVNRQHKPHASMVTHVHVSICAFDPSTNACIHVNRQHNALSTRTCVHKCQHRIQLKSSSCVYIDNLYVYAHLQQKSVSCVPKPNVSTCLYCLRPLHVCICQSTQALSGVNNLNNYHLYIHVCIGLNPSLCTLTSLCA